MKKIFKTAFTLIELLVVIAIIGILSGMIVVSMSGVTQKAIIAKGQVFDNSLRNALMLNLIAEYKLDGNANELWGGHAAGTVSGASSYPSCPQNTCYSFDAVDDYIELSDASDLRMTSGGTISAWIYPKSRGENNFGRVIDKSSDSNSTDGYSIFMGASNSFYLRVNNTGASMQSVNDALQYNQWNLIAATFNSSGRKLYVNGTDVTSTGGSETGLPPNIAGAVRIGNRATGTDYTFDGYIDEVRIYNVAVPVSLINEMYFSGLNSLLKQGFISQKQYLNQLSINK
jgi:prepilin-type N-terminal cleavage/methylation domain-containing protein